MELASRQRALGPPWRFPLPQPTRPPPPAAAAKIQNDLRILTERLARINDNLARKNLRVQLKNDSTINVCPAESASHTMLQPDVFRHVTGMRRIKSPIVRASGRTGARGTHFPERGRPRSGRTRP